MVKSKHIFTIEQFRLAILESHILDHQGIHHVFASGAHGRKLDFDLLMSSDPLYHQWVTINCQVIEEKVGNQITAVAGVANGTNRLANDIANRLALKSLTTVKLASGRVALSDQALKLLSTIKGKRVVVVEDVGTSGATALEVAKELIDNGIGQVEIVFTWQRTLQLRALSNSNITYQSIITHPLETFDAAACLDHGYCAEGWQLVERKPSF